MADSQQHKRYPSKAVDLRVSANDISELCKDIFDAIKEEKKPLSHEEKGKKLGHLVGAALALTTGVAMFPLTGGSVVPLACAVGAGLLGMKASADIAYAYDFKQRNTRLSNIDKATDALVDFLIEHAPKDFDLRVSNDRTREIVKQNSSKLGNEVLEDAPYMFIFKKPGLLSKIQERCEKQQQVVNADFDGDATIYRAARSLERAHENEIVAKEREARGSTLPLYGTIAVAAVAGLAFLVSGGLLPALGAAAVGALVGYPAGVVVKGMSSRFRSDDGLGEGEDSVKFIKDKIIDDLKEGKVPAEKVPEFINGLETLGISNAVLHQVHTIIEKIQVIQISKKLSNNNELKNEVGGEEKLNEITKALKTIVIGGKSDEAKVQAADLVRSNLAKIKEHAPKTYAVLEAVLTHIASRSENLSDLVAEASRLRGTSRGGPTP